MLHLYEQYLQTRQAPDNCYLCRQGWGGVGGGGGGWGGGVRFQVDGFAGLINRPTECLIHLQCIYWLIACRELGADLECVCCDRLFHPLCLHYPAVSACMHACASAPCLVASLGHGRPTWRGSAPACMAALRRHQHLADWRHAPRLHLPHRCRAPSCRAGCGPAPAAGRSSRWVLSLAAHARSWRHKHTLVGKKRGIMLAGTVAVVAAAMHRCQPAPWPERVLPSCAEQQRWPPRPKRAGRRGARRGRRGGGGRRGRRGRRRSGTHGADP